MDTVSDTSGHPNGGVEGVEPWDGSARDATRLYGDLVLSGMSSADATAKVYAVISGTRSDPGHATA